MLLWGHSCPWPHVLSVEHCLSKLNNGISGTQWNRYVNTTPLPACFSASFFSPFRVKLNKYLFIPTKTIALCSRKVRNKATACSTCVSPPRRKLQIARFVFYSETQTISPDQSPCHSGLQAPQSHRVQLVEMWLIIHTLIETTFIIHELLNVKAISLPFSMMKRF